MTTTALQQLTIFIARRLVVQVAIQRVVERCALSSQAKVFTGFIGPSRPLLFGPLCWRVVCDWSE